VTGTPTPPFVVVPTSSPGRSCGRSRGVVVALP
jgi:hypothetical protein